ncbi:MAG: hypothetical protein MRZ90_05300 [Candidatus Gastranaerophilales bacterium]|nr:hypothetical protein [Candidatus Gastranaerophilales bacterium]
MLTKIKYDVIIINMSKQFIAKYTPEAEQELRSLDKQDIKGYFVLLLYLSN